MANCSDLCTADSTSCVSSCGNNSICKANCGCTTCSPSSIEFNPDDTISLVPVLGYSLINCGSITKTDSSINQAVNFTITSDISDYVNDEPVCIDSFYITYDFIGLESILLNNLETYIDGEVFALRPIGQFNAGTAENPQFLFDSLYGNVNIKNRCCNIDSNQNRLIRIVEPGRYFEVSNVNVFVSGCIGNSSFTAVGAISDSTNQNSNVVRLTSLGLTSSNNFDISLCLNNCNANFRLSENFNPVLYVDCVRPGTNYIAPSDADSQGTFVGLVDFSFCVSKNVSLSKRSEIALLCDMSVNDICTISSLEECDSNG
ncbi:MAG: hypothetical protein Q4F66_01280 [Clostridium sp.]|nr:hypothetical protein [Clostridium sp.]